MVQIKDKMYIELLERMCIPIYDVFYITIKGRVN